MRREHDVMDDGQFLWINWAAGIKAFLVVIGVLAGSFVAAQDPEASIHAALDGLHESAAASNMDRYFGHYTENAVFLGTDASERWALEEFKGYAAPAFAEGRGWTYKVRSRNLIRTQSTEVYGFDEILFNEKLGLCRGSGVIEQVGDRWLISQYVLSMLIPNEIAVDVGQKSQAEME